MTSSPHLHVMILGELANKDIPKSNSHTLTANNNFTVCESDYKSRKYIPLNKNVHLVSC